MFTMCTIFWKYVVPMAKDKIPCKNSLEPISYFFIVITCFRCIFYDVAEKGQMMILMWPQLGDLVLDMSFHVHVWKGLVSAMTIILPPLQARPIDFQSWIEQAKNWSAERGQYCWNHWAISWLMAQCKHNTIDKIRTTKVMTTKNECNKLSYWLMTSMSNLFCLTLIAFTSSQPFPLC